MSTADFAVLDLTWDEILDRVGDVIAELVAKAEADASAKKSALLRHFEAWAAHGGTAPDPTAFREAQARAAVMKTAETIVQDTSRPLPDVHAGLVGLVFRETSRSRSPGAADAARGILVELFPLFVPGTSGVDPGWLDDEAPF